MSRSGESYVNVVTGVASPCVAATHAAAAAITSVLRRLPQDSSRTRAVAMLGTSTTQDGHLFDLPLHLLLFERPDLTLRAFGGG